MGVSQDTHTIQVPVELYSANTGQGITGLQKNVYWIQLRQMHLSFSRTGCCAEPKTLFKDWLLSFRDSRVKFCGFRFSVMSTWSPVIYTDLTNGPTVPWANFLLEPSHLLPQLWQNFSAHLVCPLKQLLEWPPTKWRVWLNWVRLEVNEVKARSPIWSH